MNPRLILLAFCLAGNALLATALFHQNARQSQSAVLTPIASKPVSVESAPVISDETSVATGTLPADFLWTQLVNPDFVIYIQNLRAFGTPEQKIRDIIFGAVEAMYRPRRALLQPPKKADDGKFWERRNFWVSNQGTKEQRDQLRALQKEEAGLLKSLLGADVYEQMAKDSGNDWEDSYYGSLPKELREKVSAIDQEMNEAKQDIFARAQGYIDQYAQADLKNIQKKYHDQLAQILTPDQLFEWDLRHSDTANDLKNNLSAFDPNEDEFRALFKYEQEKGTLNPPLDPDEDPPQLTGEERKAKSDQQKAMDAELAQAVGTNRVAEYKLEQDYSYRNLIDAGVPKESVFKLADMKKQAESAAQKVRNDQTLSADERKDALSAIRAETQNSVNDLLGEKNAKRYTGNGGWWLNNIAPASK